MRVSIRSHGALALSLLILLASLACPKPSAPPSIQHFFRSDSMALPLLPQCCYSSFCPEKIGQLPFPLNPPRPPHRPSTSIRAASPTHRLGTFPLSQTANQPLHPSPIRIYTHQLLSSFFSPGIAQSVIRVHSKHPSLLRIETPPNIPQIGSTKRKKRVSHPSISYLSPLSPPPV